MEQAQLLEEEKVRPIKPDDRKIEPQQKPKTFPLLGILMMCILVVLAGNTLLQLALGQSIHDKAQQLDSALHDTTATSAKMNDQLALITQINNSTRALSSKLEKVKSNTQGMHAQIAKLDKVVAEIGAVAGRIDTSTKATGEQLKQINAALAESASMMSQMVDINSDVVNSLKQIQSVQQQINDNLTAMNDKTKILEQTSILQKLGILK